MTNSELQYLLIDTSRNRTIIKGVLKLTYGFWKNRNLIIAMSDLGRLLYCAVINAIRAFISR